MVRVSLVHCDSPSKEVLTKKTMVASRSSTIRIPRTREQSCNARDAFAKALYSQLFHHVMTQVNAALNLTGQDGGQEEPQKHVIGVLDIFGFEQFEHNSFEQFSINYVRMSLRYNDFLVNDKLSENIGERTSAEAI